MSSEEQPGVIHKFEPSRRYGLVTSILSISMVALCLFAVSIGDREMDYSDWAFVALFGLFGLLGILALVLGLPRLILTPYGLEYAIIQKTSRWGWSEVGEFSVSERSAYIPFGMSRTFYYAVADSDRNHGLLHAAGHKRMATWEDADIKIIATGLRGYGKRQGAEDIVAILNSFRESYGRPEVEVDTDDLQGALSELLREKRGRREKALIVMILAPLLGAVLVWVLRYLTSR